MSATVVIYGDPSDGFLQSDSAVWATAQAGSAVWLSNYFLVICGDYDAGQVQRGYFAFDTSVVGSGNVVTDAVLSLFASAAATSVDPSMDIRARLYDWGATLAADDWVPLASLSGYPLLAHHTYLDGDSGLADYTSDDLAANVNKTGFTRIVTAQESGSGFAGARYVTLYQADQAGTTYDPRLTMTYKTPEEIAGEARRDHAIDKVLKQAFWPEIYGDGSMKRSGLKRG